MPSDSLGTLGSFMTKNKAFGAFVSWLSPPSEAISSAPARNANDQVTNLHQVHGRQLVGYLTAVYGNPDDAAEVTQETFYRMYDLLAAGHAIEQPRVWAYRVARNLMLDCLQKQRNEVVKAARFGLECPTLDTTTAEALLIDREVSLERQARLRKAFAILTETERHCVLSRGQGLSLREIADIVGLSTKRVSEVTCRAIEKMQRSVGV